MTDKTEAPSAPNARPVIPEGWKLVPTLKTLIDADPGCDVCEYIARQANVCGGIAADIYAGILDRASAFPVPLYPEALVRATGRREGLEEAAAVCDRWVWTYGSGAPIKATPARDYARDAVTDCADAIRAKFTSRQSHQPTQILINQLRALARTPQVKTEEAQRLIYDAAQRLETLSACLNPEAMKQIITEALGNGADAGRKEATNG